MIARFGGRVNAVRESALKKMNLRRRKKKKEKKKKEKNPLPKERIEPASVLRLAFWSDTGKKKVDFASGIYCCCCCCCHYYYIYILLIHYTYLVHISNMDI